MDTGKLIRRCWHFALTQEASPAAIQQTEKFFTFSAGMMFAKLLHIAAQVLLGRQAGPELYGKITVILLLSSYFSMPVVSGWGMVFTKI